jgi:uncharacterized Zn finger protein (UPF0148 family)
MKQIGNCPGCDRPLFKEDNLELCDVCRTAADLADARTEIARLKTELDRERAIAAREHDLSTVVEQTSFLTMHRAVTAELRAEKTDLILAGILSHDNNAIDKIGLARSTLAVPYKGTERRDSAAVLMANCPVLKLLAETADSCETQAAVHLQAHYPGTEWRRSGKEAADVLSYTAHEMRRVLAEAKARICPGKETP